MNGAGYAAVKESGGGLVSPACDRRALADNMLALYRMSNDERAALGRKPTRITPRTTAGPSC